MQLPIDPHGKLQSACTAKIFGCRCAAFKIADLAVELSIISILYSLYLLSMQVLRLKPYFMNNVKRNIQKSCTVGLRKTADMTIRTMLRIPKIC